MLQVLSTCIHDLCRVFIISQLELLKLISSKKEKEEQMQKQY